MSEGNSLSHGRHHQQPMRAHRIIICTNCLSSEAANVVRFGWLFSTNVVGSRSNVRGGHPLSNAQHQPSPAAAVELIPLKNSASPVGEKCQSRRRKGLIPSRRGPIPSRSGLTSLRKGPIPSRKGLITFRKGPIPSRTGPIPLRKRPIPSRKGLTTSRKGAGPVEKRGGVNP